MSLSCRGRGSGSRGGHCAYQKSILGRNLKAARTRSNSVVWDLSLLNLVTVCSKLKLPFISKIKVFLTISKSKQPARTETKLVS